MVRPVNGLPGCYVSTIGKPVVSKNTNELKTRATARARVLEFVCIFGPDAHDPQEEGDDGHEKTKE